MAAKKLILGLKTALFWCTFGIERVNVSSKTAVVHFKTNSNMTPPNYPYVLNVFVFFIRTLAKNQ